MVYGGLSTGGKADLMHKKAIKYVRAESQARAIKQMMNGFLTEEELGLVKRARNHKTPNRSRSAGAVEYRLELVSDFVGTSEVLVLSRLLSFLNWSSPDILIFIGNLISMWIHTTIFPN